MVLDSGVRIRNFTLSSKLGEGGMGEVWKATLDLVGKEIAVKFMRPEIQNNSRLEQRFLHEARTMARLCHDRIVPLNDFFVQDGLFVLIMPYIQGTSLEHYIDNAPNGLPIEQVLGYSKDLLSALHYAHQQGVIHRDIKPSNALITSDSKTYLMDFGIAKAAGEQSLTQTGSAIGTVSYMSPEQIMEPDKLDRRADIYSFGVMLYEMLAGRLPFNDSANDGGTAFRIQTAHCTQPPPPLHEFNPTIPKNLEDVVLRALAKRPDERYADCLELLQALQNYAQNGPQPRIQRQRTVPEQKRPGAGIPEKAQVDAAPPVQSLGQPSRFKYLLIAGAAALVLTAGAASFYFKPSQSSGTQQSGDKSITIKDDTAGTPGPTPAPSAEQNGQRPFVVNPGAQRPPVVPSKGNSQGNGTADPGKQSGRPGPETDATTRPPEEPEASNGLAVAKREENRQNYCKALEAAQKAGTNSAYISKLTTNCNLYGDAQ